MVKKNSQLNAVFFIFYSNCFNEWNVWTPLFLKNCVTRSISLLYTFGELLAKSLKTTPLNLLLITEKAFQWTWLVEPRLWSSFTVHWITLCKSIHILVYLLRSWTCLDACTVYPHITLTWECVDILSGLETMKRNLPIKRKTNDFDS